MIVLRKKPQRSNEKPSCTAKTMTWCRIYGRPVPQGNHRIKNGKVYDSAGGLTAWRDSITWRLKGKYGIFRGASNDQVSLSIVFFLQRPKSAPKERTAPTVRPDLDKLVRAVLDACTGVLYADDSQVTEIRAKKQYVDEKHQEGVWLKVIDDA